VKILSPTKKYSLLTILFVTIVLVLTITNSSESADKPLKSPAGNMSPIKSLDSKPHPKKKRIKQDTKPIVFKDDKLTVKISAPLKVVMERISSLTGVEIVWVKSDIYEQVSLGFSDRALDEAVKYILHGKNYMLLYRSTDKGAKLGRILILPHGNGGEVSVHNFQPDFKNHIPPMAKQPKPDIRKKYPDNYDNNTFRNYKNINPVTKGRRFYSGDRNGDTNITSAPDGMVKGQPTDSFAMSNKNIIGKEGNNSSLVPSSPDINTKSLNNDYVIVIENPSHVWDDFENGNANGWLPDNADQWRVERVEDESEYCMMPNNGGIPSVSLREDLDVTNSMTISVEALEQGDGRQKNFFIVFGYDELNNNAYFAGARVDENKWVIEERSLSHNAREVRDEDSMDIINTNTWYDLELVISGANVDLYAKESTVLDYGDPKASFDLTPENGFPDGILGGKIGLGGIYNHAHFDEFSVTYSGEIN
jgi:hypothetical protein